MNVPHAVKGQPRIAQIAMFAKKNFPPRYQILKIVYFNASIMFINIMIINIAQGKKNVQS